MSCDYEGPFHDYNCSACNEEIRAKTIAQQASKHSVYQELAPKDNTKGALARVILFGIIAIGVMVYLTQYA